MNLVSKLDSGTRSYDRLVGREWLVRGVEDVSQVVFPSLKHAQTSMMERQPLSLVRLERRLERLCIQDVALPTNIDIISLDDRVCMLALLAMQHRRQAQ